MNMWNRLIILTSAHNPRMLETKEKDCCDFEHSLEPQLHKGRKKNGVFKKNA